MLIDDIENYGDVDGVTGVDEAPQTVTATELRVGREVVQRAIAPVEIKLDAGDGHEFEAVDAETLQIIKAVDDTVESVVELFDLQFVDDEVVEFGRFVGGV